MSTYKQLDERSKMNHCDHISEDFEEACVPYAYELPVVLVPHKAVAEVSKTGNLQESFLFHALLCYSILPVRLFVYLSIHVPTYLSIY